MPPRLSSWLTWSWLALALKVMAPCTESDPVAVEDIRNSNYDLHENSEQRTNFAQTTTCQFFLVIVFPNWICFKPNSESIYPAWGQGTAATCSESGSFFQELSWGLGCYGNPCRHEGWLLSFTSFFPASSEPRDLLGMGQYCINTRAYSSYTWLA